MPLHELDFFVVLELDAALRVDDIHGLRETDWMTLGEFDKGERRRRAEKADGRIIV